MAKKKRRRPSSHGMNSCFNRITHSDMDFAIAEAKRKNMRVYLCRQCRLYHLAALRSVGSPI